MEKIAYAAYHKEEKELEKSSSGAIFIAISDYVLKNNGVVIAASYNYETHKLEHIICKNNSEIDSCRGSKYIQSYIDKKIYMSVENYLNENKMVFYIGMPCQIAAIKKYLSLKKVNMKTFFTCDILCHGVGSQGIWNKFINYIEEKEKMKVTYLSFKDKRNGWMHPLCIAKGFQKEVSLRGYSWLYFSDSIMRPSCYNCKYSNINREGDITIGDFWKIEKKCPQMYNPMGTSFMIINSRQGKLIFEKIKNQLVYQKCTLEDCMQSNFQKSTRMGKNHDKIMKDYISKSTRTFFNKWKFIIGLNKLLNKFNR